jgi:hypothetical protein
MGVDTTFQPKTPTYVVDSSAPVTIDGRQDGVTSWRLRASLSGAGACYVKWAQGATNPGATATPAVGAVMPNQVGINNSTSMYVEGIGAWLTFISNLAFATGSVEITGGQGGCAG